MKPLRRQTVNTARPSPASQVEYTAIRTLPEPTPGDIQRSLVLLVHIARELLSTAERQCDWVTPSAPTAHRDAQKALRLLKSALELYADLRNVELRTSRSETYPDPTTLMARAITATRSTLAQIALYQSYSHTKGRTDLDKRQSQLYLSTWRRAAQAAKQEAHRTLAVLAELYPHAAEDTR